MFLGIDKIESMFERPASTTITINTLLDKTGYINDEEVHKMIWVVCYFEKYLMEFPGDNSDEFISFLSSKYTSYVMYSTYSVYSIPSIDIIAKSIATLAIRVFIAFQTKINGVVPSSEEATAKRAAALAQHIPVLEDEIARVTDEVIIEDLIKDHTEQDDDDVKKNAHQKKMQAKKKIKDNIEVAPARVSERVKKANEAVAAARREREKLKEDQKQEEYRRKMEIIQRERANLRDCMNKIGRRTQFIRPIPDDCLLVTDPVDFKFDVSLFYKSLTLALPRFISCIQRRLAYEDIKPGPGTADTMNSLGLPDPSVNTKDEEGESPSNGGARRIGITKRKKNNKIIVKLKSKLKKHSQKIFYGGVSASVRSFGEHAPPITQCDNAIDNYHKYERPSCYICGEPWIEELQSSMECEHILCVIHAIEYYGLLQTVYLDDSQKKFLSILYAWAHRCCNQRKRNTAFIRKNHNHTADARGNHFIPDDVNIRELLAEIFTLSLLSDTDAGHKLDCNKILKKGKYRDKKHFVEVRTPVVTKYVKPLIDCINSVFTGLFQSNMVLFNAVGCLKILSEFNIYLTAEKKKSSCFKLQLSKTAEFMDRVVFPNCKDTPAVGMGGGRRIFHDKKTRKSLRRKIQRGGAKNITDFFTGVVAQKEYETEIREFKNIATDFPEDGVYTELSDVDVNPLVVLLKEKEYPNPTSTTTDFKTGHRPRIQDTTKMDAILFILFILNHYRNPTILLGLFLELDPSLTREGYISSEISNYQNEEASDEEASVNTLTIEAIKAKLGNSYDEYNTERRLKKDAFIAIFQRVVDNHKLLIIICKYLNTCNMLPSLLGVITFCIRQDSITEKLDPSVLDRLTKDTQLLLGHINSNLVDEQFKHKLVVFAHVVTSVKHSHSHSHLFATAIVTTNTPLDNLVNACVYLKDCDNTRDNLLEACCLFPSCFDDQEYIFSKFGPCHAYARGVLKNPNFQKALGCVAVANTMCASMLIKEQKEHTTSRCSHSEGTEALKLFSVFFDQLDREILENCLLDEEVVRPGFVNATYDVVQRFGAQVGATKEDIEATYDVVQRFGAQVGATKEDIENDLSDFGTIMVAMIWNESPEKPHIIPSNDVIYDYTWSLIDQEREDSARKVATFLNSQIGRQPIDEDHLANYILYLFVAIVNRMPHKQTVSGKNDFGVPETVQKKPISEIGHGGNPQLFPPTHPSPSQDNHDTPRYNMAQNIIRFVDDLISEIQHSELADSYQSNSGEINIKIGELSRKFYKSVQNSYNEITRLMNAYLSMVIQILWESQLSKEVILSPPGSSSRSRSSSPIGKTDSEIANYILETYEYFQGDYDTEDQNIKGVLSYIMAKGEGEPLFYRMRNHLRRRDDRRDRSDSHNGGSSSHRVKRQNRNMRCKKPKIKSRRKNKYNTTKTRKNRRS